MNDTETIIKYLKLYNEWRRGDEKMGQPNPAEIGKLIDEACEKLFLLKRERDEAREKYDNLATEHMLVVNKLCEERDEAQNASEAFSALAWKLEGERDEARGVASGLAKQAERLRKERDEALKEVEHWKDMYRTVSIFKP